MHATAAPTLALPSRKVMLGIGLFLTFIAGLMPANPATALRATPPSHIRRMVG
jgi:hypothetical protein